MCAFLTLNIGGNRSVLTFLVFNFEIDLDFTNSFRNTISVRKDTGPFPSKYRVKPLTALRKLQF